MADKRRDGSNATGVPPWAEEVRRTFRGGTVSQFVLHGNVHDLVRLETEGGGGADDRYLPLKRFLDEVLFAPFEAVLHYDRARGITIGKGAEDVHVFLRAFDQWNSTDYARKPHTMPREPTAVLTLLDRFVHYALRRTRIEDGKVVPAPLRAAVVLDFAQFVVPRGDVLQLSNAYSESLLRLLALCPSSATTFRPGRRCWAKSGRAKYPYPPGSVFRTPLALGPRSLPTFMRTTSVPLRYAMNPSS